MVAWPLAVAIPVVAELPLGIAGLQQKIAGPMLGRLIHRLLRGFRLIPLLLGRLRHRALLPF
ncbi:hypothetical protein BL171B_03760 [Bifidobacterium longum subsp. longum 17-1B]|nr:hypothetical protein BL171B_03760 [Bifidobacterium longum subsp. longum 17-1B]